MCKVFFECKVVFGEVGNGEYLFCLLGKAGVICWCGIRLIVCGVVMNPVDHLYGGGEGRIFGGCHLVSPWGMPTKGFKICKNKCTDNFIVRCCNCK
jgi:large subunit ribosomal protein L2